MEEGFQEEESCKERGKERVSEEKCLHAET